MGLLDFMGTGTDDPRTAATLALAQGLLSAPRGRGMLGLSQGLLGYQGAMGAAKDAELKRSLVQSQLEENRAQAEQRAQQAAAMRAQQQQQQADMALTRRMFAPVQPIDANAVSGVAGPRPEALGAVGQTRPFDPRAFLTSGGSLEGLNRAAQANELISPAAKPDDYKVVGGNLVRIGRDNKVTEAYRGEPKDPESLRLIEAAFPKGSPEYLQAVRMLAMKTASHAPGTQVNVNTEKPLLNTVAQGLGKQLDDGLSSARSAVGAVANAQKLMAAVDSGKLAAGPGASFRVLGLQIGQQLGVGGKDGAEMLANTRSAIQSMAQAELDAAQQMKGQGQITESERDIIKRAAAGDIDKLTASEVRQLATTIEKAGRAKIKQHQTNLRGLSGMQGAAPLIPFYQVEDPAAYTPPASAGAPRRYNPQTGRIE